MSHPVRETARMTVPIRELVGPKVEHRARTEAEYLQLAAAFTGLGDGFAEVWARLVAAFAPLAEYVQRPSTKADYALVSRGDGTVGRRPSRHTDPLSQRPATGPQVPAFPKRGKK